MRQIYAILCVLLVLCMLSLGVVSLVDKDPEISRIEKRDLSSFPKVTVSALLDGSFARALVEYYADTFPGREDLAVKKYELNRFFAPSLFSQEHMEEVLTGLEENQLP